MSLSPHCVWNNYISTEIWVILETWLAKVRNMSHSLVFQPSPQLSQHCTQMSSEGAVKMSPWCHPDQHHFAGERPLLHVGMWWRWYSFIRGCKGQMNSVSEGYQSDWRCRCLDITQVSKPPPHPPCSTDVRTVSSASEIKGQTSDIFAPIMNEIMEIYITLCMFFICICITVYTGCYMQ